MSDSHSAASNRIQSVLDANSFVEIGAGVTARSTDFNPSASFVPSDGVITGFGTVDGNLVYVYSQDVTACKGTLGEMHARKIISLYRMARKMGAPVIGMIDCAGVRLEESVDALNAMGGILRNQAKASGVVPQITMIYGRCGGGLSLIPAMSDFVFMEKDASLFVNAPDAVEGVSKDDTDISSAGYQSAAGHVDMVGTADEIASAVRSLIPYLPLNNMDESEQVICMDDLNRSVAGAASLKGRELIKAVADGGVFFEMKSGYGEKTVTGLMRLGGRTVGAVAYTDEKLCVKCVKKASSLVRFCDAFNIPVVTFADVTRFGNCECVEKNMPDAASRLAFAYVTATVPKVTVVTGKAYGTPYLITGSKAMGADMVYAWDSASVGVMDSKMAAKILSDKTDAASLKETAARFDELQQSAASAAARGYVDTVIKAEDTRKYLIGALEMLFTKRVDTPDRKHASF